ncbi:MAG: hypothetical protein P4L33_10565 [Capsulimonadaceae bacterium]|nr:hypothetical protein [Capsulimonadaceae bacterium]
MPRITWEDVARDKTPVEVAAVFMRCSVKTAKVRLHEAHNRMERDRQRRMRQTRPVVGKATNCEARAVSVGVVGTLPKKTFADELGRKAPGPSHTLPTNVKQHYYAARDSFFRDRDPELADRGV